MSNVVSSPLSTTAIFSVPDVAKWRKGAMQNQEMTPAEAVLAGAILFPEDEVPWYERTISLPKQFEGVTPVPQADVDEPSISGPSYVVYAFFSGFLVLLVLIAIIAYIISYIATKPAEPVPLVLCYYDPTTSTKYSPYFTRFDLCVECCSHLVYDGLDVDARGIINERQSKGPAPSDTIGDWLALKQTSRLKLLVGLRFQATAQFTTATDQRITQLVQTLRDHYNAPSGWDGVVISRTGADAAKEIVLYEALHKDIAKSNFQIIAHVLPASIQFYNFPLMHRYVDFIVVETHDFIVQGKAYPPCMYEAGGTIDASGKNLVDVLNAIQNVDRQVMNKLVPTVSTVGKKYDFLDALATKPGDPVFRTIPEDEPLVDTELVKKKRLAGIAVLNIEQDDRFACTSDNHPFLLGAVYSELRLHSS
ncbi:uncharacterized protein [Dermacentor andersoni]|uniref:uncharacterized protein isoform X2 n=1 Tax=Dermacentor andersoni TaxID=34620 RepID=UPI002415CA4B|nr:uncharacterized protein LOC129380621 isoform X2 [Dermacentor andersoni]